MQQHASKKASYEVLESAFEKVLRRGAKGGKPREVLCSTFLEGNGASKKVAFPFSSKRKGTF